MSDTTRGKTVANADGDPLGAGTKIRLRRKVRGLSLKDVAEKCDISIAQLSQIERGASSPSLRLLGQVCAAVSMPIGWLFETSDAEEHPNGVVVHAKHRRTLQLADGGMIKQLLTPDTCRSIQMMKVIVHPGGSSGQSPYTARGAAECGTILEGTLGLDIDGEHFTVPAGDTFAFEGTRAVRFWCIGNETCVVIWTATPASY